MEAGPEDPHQVRMAEPLQQPYVAPQRRPTLRVGDRRVQPQDHRPVRLRVLGLPEGPGRREPPHQTVPARHDHPLALTGTGRHRRDLAPRHPPGAVLAHRRERLTVHTGRRARRSRDERLELSRHPARPVLDQGTDALQQGGGVVPGRAGQAAQQQVRYAGTEGVGAGGTRDGGQQPAEDDLGDVLGPRVRVDGGLHQAHDRQIGAAQGQMAGQPEGLRGGAAPEAQDQFLGGEAAEVRTVVGVRRNGGAPVGHGPRERRPARRGDQPGPVRQPLGGRFQHRQRERSLRWEPVAGAGGVVGGEGERRGGCDGVRGGEPVSYTHL